jgi:hypothetical protein
VSAFQWIVASTIAGFAALIGYFQWRTAHQRVVLDLFDRRNKVYSRLKAGADSINGSGKATPEVEIEIGRAIEESRFFFGDDVISYLEEWLRAVIDLGAYSIELEDTRGVERGALIQVRRAALERVLAFYKDSPRLFAPYMRLDQKMPRLWWPR